MPDYDSVGTVAFFRERHRVESATTKRVLSALPSNGLEYTPHQRSSTAGHAAWTMVRGLQVSRTLLSSSTAEVSQTSHPDNATLLLEFEANAKAIAEMLLNVVQHAWMQDRTVTSNGAVILHQPLGQILWLFHVDAIHHRGQLSTYLRPLGAKVPSIYGPSGDEHHAITKKENL